MSSLGNDGLVVGIKGAGIAPAVISVIRCVAVAVTVTAELPAGVVDAAPVFIWATEKGGGCLLPVAVVP